MNSQLRTVLVTTLVTLTIMSTRVAAQDTHLEERIQLLTRSSGHRVVTAVDLAFNTHHTQGMTRANDHYFMTAVQTIDSAKGMGKGHLFRFSEDGVLDKQIELGDGPAYHPGGIDFDGKFIWVSVAEYRPDSSSIVYRVDPKSMEAEEMFRFNDHLGGIVSTRKQLIGMSWGSRIFYRWELDANGRVTEPANPHKAPNPSHFIDYQDGQWIPETNLIIVGGLASFGLEERRGGSAAVGGIALIDATTLRPVFEVPLPIYSKRGRIMNQNPFYVESSEKGIRIRFVPDDNRSTLYTVEFPQRLNRVEKPDR